MAGPPEGVSAADAGGGGGQLAAAAAPVLRAAVSPVQEEDAAGSTQPGAGPAERGTSSRRQGALQGGSGVHGCVLVSHVEGGRNLSWDRLEKTCCCV